MKRKLILASLALAAATALFINGCKKDEDTTPPVVTVNGSVPIIVLNGTVPADPGATAKDDEDGTIAASSDWSSTNPNKDKAGNYTITYTATDAAGNRGTATRTVTVRNDAYYLAGTYKVIENSIDTFPQTITVSSTENNVIWFNKFANYANNDSITAKVSSSVSLFPTPQSAFNIGTSGCDHTFAANGTGNLIVTVAGKSSFSIKFTDKEEVGGASCPGTAPVAFEDLFVQQ